MPKRKTRDEEEAEDDIDIDVGEAPTSINPYEVLSVTQDATPEQIRRAYRQAALKHHPDKALDADKASAHRRFQEVALAYAVLSDERRRRRYDTTGRTEESLDDDDENPFDWATFYRAQFREVVTEETIRRFADGYRGGAEERAHVLAAYARHGGRMTKVYQDVMLSDMLVDEARFRAMIDAAIADGEVAAHAPYTDEGAAARRKRIERERKRQGLEAKEAEAVSKELEEEKEKEKDTEKKGKGRQRGGKKAANGDVNGGGGTAGLAALIQQRQKNRAEDFFANLEAKYAPAGKRGGKSAAAMDEPSEEAFARNAKKKSSATSDTGARPKRVKK